MKITPKQKSCTHVFEVLTPDGLYEMALVFEEGKLSYEWVREYDAFTAKYRLCTLDHTTQERMRNEILRSQISILP